MDTIYEAAENLYFAADPQARYRPDAYQRRIAKLADVLEKHPRARVESCADENTGCRYGNAKCRAGRAVKIGYTSYVRQWWAVW